MIMWKSSMAFHSSVLAEVESVVVSVAVVSFLVPQAMRRTRNRAVRRVWVVLLVMVWWMLWRGENTKSGFHLLLVANAIFAAAFEAAHEAFQHVEVECEEQEYCHAPDHRHIEIECVESEAGELFRWLVQ